MTKSVSQLCREAIELRSSAPDSGNLWINDGLKNSSPDSPFVYFIVGHGHYEIEDARADKEFYAFAANHIKAIAGRCLELEKELEEFKQFPMIEVGGIWWGKNQIKELIRIKSHDDTVHAQTLRAFENMKEENQKLRDELEALKGGGDERKEYF